MIKIIKNISFENKVKLIIDKKDQNIAVFLRSFLFHEIKSYSINKIKFKKGKEIIENETINWESQYNNETIGHRISLIPFIIDNLEENETISKKKIFLKKINKTEIPIKIYSDSIISEDKNIIISKGIALTVLKKNQGIQMEAILEKGSFSDHAKYQTIYNFRINSFKLLKEQTEFNDKVIIDDFINYFSIDENMYIIENDSMDLKNKIIKIKDKKYEIDESENNFTKSHIIIEFEIDKERNLHKFIKFVFNQIVKKISEIKLD